MYKEIVDMNMSNNIQIKCSGVTITILEKFNELWNELNVPKWNNPKWRDDLEKYQHEISQKTTIQDQISYHINNCSKISSLRNRVFANYEWDILKEHWITIQSQIKIEDVKDADSKYNAVTGNLFKLFKEEWERKKAEAKKDNLEKREKQYPRPYAEINRLFAGFNLDKLCPIVDDNSLKDLIKGLVAANCIEISEGEEILLKTGQDKGGWLIRSFIVNELFNNNKTIPWGCLKKLQDTRLNDLLKENRNIIFTGAPGTGKTYLARKIAAEIIGCDIKDLKGSGQYDFVQFHPSYDYTDFVEGLRPNPNNTNSFVRQDGIFKVFCANAAKAEEEDNKKTEEDKRKFVFIIDEINRGEISKIFGELFFSIDPGYRGESDKDGISNRIDTQYQRLVPDGDIFKTGFYVPKNVYVIGTMNDIDRSVESMDFAFRRRFAFYEVAADPDMLNSLLEEDGDFKGYDSQTIEVIKQHMRRLNDELVKEEYGLTTAYQIGGAYFLKFKNYYNESSYKQQKADNAFKSLWENNLRGTLFEYFRGLPQKEINDKMEKLKKAYDGK